MPRHFLCFCLLLAFSRAAFPASCNDTAYFQPANEDTWAGWGASYANTRFNNTDNNPINSSTLQRLQLKWAYGFDNARSVIGNPALHGNRIFIGDENGQVYSLDRDSGCEDWVFQADNGVRTMPLIENINGRWLVIFGDRSANVFAVDALTGQQVWKVEVEEHPAAILTGAPQYLVLENEPSPHRIIIPVSSGEEGLGAVPTYPCCSFQGSVVTVDAETGLFASAFSWWASDEATA